MCTRNFCISVLIWIQFGTVTLHVIFVINFELCESRFTNLMLFLRVKIKVLHSIRVTLGTEAVQKT
jgi:hypothetical protein